MQVNLRGHIDQFSLCSVKVINKWFVFFPEVLEFYGER